MIESALTSMVDTRHNFRETAFTPCAFVSGQCDRTEDKDAIFWQQWQQYRDYLYRCCLKWMGGNQANAEDALSRAMLKAWGKIQEGGIVIRNLKAWLTQLTYNLCIDIYRERNRNAVGAEDLDTIALGEEWVSQEDTPILAATQQELEQFLRDAIDNLPSRLREPFILYVEKEQSYRDIARELSISYDNVRKRISQARAILRERLNEYEGGKTSTPRQSQRQEKSKTTTRQAPVETESVTSSEELKAVQVVASEEPQALTPCVLQPAPTLVESQSDGDIEDDKRNPSQAMLTLEQSQKREPEMEAISSPIPLPDFLLSSQCSIPSQEEDSPLWGAGELQGEKTNLVQEVLKSIELCWRVQSDSGGCWLLSI